MPQWTKEQMAAINLSGSNIIVSAGAGSGKTAVLTERVITKLKQGIKINELLILTFTNAASKEMQDRIRDEISKYPELKDNLDYLESSYITTFDSYTLSLVKKYNYLLNVSNNLSIIDDSILSIKKEEILNNVFLEMYDSNNPLFLKLIKDFCIKNDNNIQETILNYIKNIDNEIDRDNFLKHYLDTYLSTSKIDNYIKEYLDIIYEIINNIENNIMLIGESSYQEYYTLLCNTFSDLIYAKEYDDIYKYFDLLNIPKRPNGSEEIKEYKEKIDNDCKELKKYLRFKNVDEIKESFIIMQDYLKVIIEILQKYYLRIDEYKFNNDLYEFSDIAKMAIKLLKEHENIRLELKNYYHEIMVDEYQDTNNIQEEFIKLIANNNVYMVGDIKQSIYGFRNAKPQIFKDKYDKYNLKKGGIKIDLLKNFRSRREVLEGINLIFSYIMDDYLGGCDYKNAHQMQFGNTMYELKNKEDDYQLEILNYDNLDKNYSNEEIESFIIGFDILNKIKNNYEIIDKKSKQLRKINYSDICIIMDRGTSFNVYKKVFEYLGIPLNLYMDKTLTNEIDIIILNNLITLILKIYKKEYDAEFKYNFVSVARSFLFNYDDKTIFNIIKDNTYYKTSVYEFCLEISKHLDTLNIYEILQLIIQEIDYYTKIIKIGNVLDCLIRLDNILDMANTLNTMGYSLEEFNNYLKEIINSKKEIKYSVNTNDNNAVKIMNIHKSKGLEFPICYFSGLYKTFNNEEIKDKFTYSSKYKMIFPYYKEGIGYTILKDLFRHEYTLNDISERIRLFYVALTRAKEKIIIVGSFNNSKEVSITEREKYNSFLSFLISIKKILKPYIKDIDLNKYPITKDYLYNKKTLLDLSKTDKIINYQKININKDLLEEEKASKKIKELLSIEDRDKLNYGTKIHKVFEEVDFLNINNKHPYYSLINKLVTNLNIKVDTKIYKEHEFIYNKDNMEYHGIIDLILEDKDEVRIVDYKLKEIKEEEYIKQLNIYYTYLKDVFQNKKIKMYLYSILDGKIEEVEKICQI